MFVCVCVISQFHIALDKAKIRILHIPEVRGRYNPANILHHVSQLSPYPVAGFNGPISFV